MSTATLTRPPSTYSRQMVLRQSPQNQQQQQQQQEDDGGNLTTTTQPLSKRRRSSRRIFGGAGGGGGGMGGLRKVPPPLLRKVGLAAQVYGIQGLMGTVTWLQEWREWLYPPGGGPNIVKVYEARPGMAVRIFFPASYDLTSPQTLPTVLTIHGGGFCIGTARDDDQWNRRFADSQNMLVISLPYQKAPRAPFPAALQDLEALYLAVIADESLPIDRTSSTYPASSSSTTPTPRSSYIRRSGFGLGHPPRRPRPVGRVALLGFDAGGNLALGLSQLSGVRHSAVPPTAVVSVAGYLDLERAAGDKLAGRPYKPALSPPRNSPADPLAATYPAYVWSYVPYGHDLRDPLLSPAFASWKNRYEEEDDHHGGGGDHERPTSSLSAGAGVAPPMRSYTGSTTTSFGSSSSSSSSTSSGRIVNGGLPPHVCLVGAELDMLAHESWRLACRLVRDGGIARGDGRTGRWRVPDPDAVLSPAARAAATATATGTGEGTGEEKDAGVVAALDLVKRQRTCGRAEPAPAKGRLEVLEDELRASSERAEDGVDGSKRFGFEVRWRGNNGSSSSGEGGGGGEGSGSVKWILVPDVLHGFDRGWWMPTPGVGGGAVKRGAEETIKDAVLKTVAYVDAVGAWLRGTVWEM